MTVDLSSWNFEYRHDTPTQRALREYEPSIVPAPEQFRFADPDALLRHLDGPGSDDASRFQQSISERLEKDTNVLAIKKLRTNLKELKHFSAYRGCHYDKYHEAARRIGSGTGTEDDRELIDGFDAEVAASRISLEANQILFHGRCNDLLVTEHPYPSYVSATLDPIVALNSAYRRAGSMSANGRPLVFVLKLCVPLPALWGHVGNSAEWEVLLPRGVDWKETKRQNGKNFDIVHAEATAISDSTASAGSS